MPMIPGPAAALTLTALKVGGYTAFARSVSARYSERVKPLVFGAIKTLIGFIGGFFFLGVISTLGTEAPTPLVLAAATLLRLGVWLYVLKAFFPATTADRHVHWKLAGWGLACTYAIDAVTFGLVYLLRGAPGMMIGVC